MSDVPQQLGRALGAGTAEGGTILIPDHWGAAHRADLRQHIRHRSIRPLCKVHLHDLRNDLSGFLNNDRVSHPDVLFRDIILVVKGGVGDSGSCQAHRLQHRLRGQHAGTAHLYHNIQYPGGLLFRRIFKGHRPLGEFGSRPQFHAICEGVYLYNRAVNIERIVQALIINAGDLLLKGICPMKSLVGNDLEPLGTEILQCLSVGQKQLSLRQLQIKHLDVQPPLGADLRVQLPQRACGGVAGIGHQRFTLQLPHGIDLLKY